MSRWDDRSVPKSGWTLVEVVDERPDDPDGSDPTDTYPDCEMCDREHIRFVHHLQHPALPGETLLVGCVCSSKLTGDPATAKARETTARNRASRRAKWLTRRWRESAAGRPFLKVDGHHVVVFPAGGGWGFRVDGAPRYGFATERDAKLAAFDRLFPNTA